MFEVLKETPRRLVVASGEGARRHRQVLDKDAGYAWFEQSGAICASRVTQIKRDIAGVDSIEAQPRSAEGRLVIKLASGRSKQARVVSRHIGRRRSGDAQLS